MRAAFPTRGEVAATRLERAETSNPDGWRAITEASTALSEPTYGLPLELLSRLESAVERLPDEHMTTAVLHADAAAALRLAERLQGRPTEFEPWVEAFMAHDWMWQLPWDLARGGLIDDATQVADAFAELDPDRAALYANDAAVLLAEAGRAEEARARVDINLRAYPNDIWTHVHAGDVHHALADPDRAEHEFRRAAAMAEARGDRDDVSVIAERLRDVLRSLPGREQEAAQAARTAERMLVADELGQRIAPPTGASTGGTDDPDHES